MRARFLNGFTRARASTAEAGDDGGVGATGDATSGRGMALLLAVAVLLPISGTLGELGTQIAFNVVLYMVLALGLNLVVGFAGLLDLGYIAFFGIGAYLYGMLASGQLGMHWPILVVIPLAAVVAAVCGVLFGVPTLRLRGDYLAIVTLGFGEIVQLLANNATGLTNGPNGIYGIDRADLGVIRLTSMTHYYYVIVGAAALMIVITLRLGRSRIGRAWAAIRDDEAAARASGVNTVRMKLLAFGMGAAVAGAIGPVFAASQAYIGPVQITLDASVLVLTMVILGGPASVRGVLLGAAILALLPEFLRQYAGARFVVVGVVMVAITILRPQGLIPPQSRPLTTARRLVVRLRRTSSRG
jgi:branched-chain amino acid transport system permease protein